jgi:hypothetical protein
VSSRGRKQAWECGRVGEYMCERVGRQPHPPAPSPDWRNSVGRGGVVCVIPPLLNAPCGVQERGLGGEARIRALCNSTCSDLNSSSCIREKWTYNLKQEKGLRVWARGKGNVKTLFRGAACSRPFASDAGGLFFFVGNG